MPENPPQKKTTKKTKQKNKNKQQKNGECEKSVIPLVVGALGTIIKGIERKLGKMEIRVRIEISDVEIR